MVTLKRFLRLFINRIFFERLTAYLLLVLIFFLFKDFLFIFFLTFIFSYLFYTLGKFLKQKLDRFIDKHKFSKTLKKVFGLNLIIALEYLIFIMAIAFTVSDLVPSLIQEMKTIPQNIPFLKEPFDIALEKLNELQSGLPTFGDDFSKIITADDLSVILDLLNKLKSIWTLILKFVLALILSFIFIVDRKKLGSYLNGIEGSSFSFFYREYSIIFEKLARSFGLIFKAQSLIAITNMILTSIGLYFIWLFYPGGFPYILTLAIIVFIFGFIPVFGTFISSFPIMLIAFTIGWFTAVFQIVFLIALVHTIEAYYLNPKIVSSFTEIPISLTFIILLVGEHFFWMLWLIIWVSGFYFVLELLKDLDKVLLHTNATLKKNTAVANETKQMLKWKMRMSRKDQI